MNRKTLCYLIIILILISVIFHEGIKISKNANINTKEHSKLKSNEIYGIVKEVKNIEGGGYYLNVESNDGDIYLLYYLPDVICYIDKYDVVKVTYMNSSIITINDNSTITGLVETLDVL